LKLRSIILLGFIILTILSNPALAQNCSVNAGVPQTICANQSLYLHGNYTDPLQSGAQVVWSQVGGPAATIVSPTNLNTQVTNLIAGSVYTFRITTTCADGVLTFQDVTETILPITIANAGPDATYCPGHTATLTANAPGAGESGAWTGSGFGISVDDLTSPTSLLTITGNTSGTATLRWTITNPTTGCTSYDDVNITNLGGVSVTAGPDVTLGNCYSTTQSTNLSGSYAGSGNGQIGTWTVVSGPNVPTIASSHANNSSVSGLIQGTYLFRWTVTGPCASGTATMQVTVPAPTSSVTGASITGGNQVFCDPTITSTVLTGSVPQYINETVTWSQTGGPTLPAGSIVSPNSPVTVVNNLVSPNSYTFTYRISNSLTGCSSSASVSVSYDPNTPTLVINTTDPLILPCQVSTASIYFTAGGSGTTQWQILSGATNATYTSFPTAWVNVSSSPLVINGLTSSGTFLVQMRRVTTTGGGCSTPLRQISVVTSFDAVKSNAGTDQSLPCGHNYTDLIGNDPTPGQGTWSQVAGPTAVFLSDPHAPRLSISSLNTDAVYIFRWVISNGPICPTSQSDVKVIVAASTPLPHNPGPNQSDKCYNTPVYLAATPADPYETGTWTVSPSSGVVFSDVHSATAVVTGLQPYTTYTFTWTMSNGCGSAASSMTVDVIGTQGPMASNAGPDQCHTSGTASITMAGNNPSPWTGEWSLISGATNATFTNKNLYNTTVTGMTDGDYVFQWAITSGIGCDPTKDQVEITIGPSIQSFNAGADQQICGNTATLTTSLGAEPSPGTGHWSQVSGNAGVTIASPNTYTTSVTGFVSGTYVFRYTITNGACSAYDDVTIYISYPPPSAADGGPDKSVCGGTSVTMAGVAPTSGTGLWSEISGPNTANIVTPSSPTSTINGLITGTYMFRWTVSGGIYCTPTTANVQVTVTLNADAGPDQNYCEAITSVNLVGTLASSGYWSEISGATTVTFTPTSGNTAIASGLIPGSYVFQYAITATGCSSTDQMNVTLYPPPSTADAGPDQSICNASSFTMAATPPVFGTGTWTILYQDNPGGSFDFPHAYNAVFSTAPIGVSIFQWTVANGSCSNADQVRITNYAPPSAAAPGPNQIVNCATTATMAATNPAVGTGLWTFVSATGGAPTPTISNPLLYNTGITGLGPQTDGNPATYTFRWTVSNGLICTPNTKTMTIMVYQLPSSAYAGPDQTFCNLTSAVMAATQVTLPTIGYWSQISGATNASFSDINAATSTVYNLVPGNNYVFRWTTSIGPCSSYDDVSINDNATPTVADASGTTTSYCTLVPMVLVGNPPVIGTGIWTQTSGPAVIILSPNSPTTSAVGGTSGNSYGFQWTISNGACGSSSSGVTVTMNIMPPQAQAGPDQDVCNPATSTTLAASALLSASYILTNPLCSGSSGSISVSGVGGYAPYTYKLDGGSAVTSGLFTNLSVGNHSVLVTDQGSCTYLVQFKITVPTALSISKSSQTDVACHSSATGSVLMAASGGTPAYTFSVQSQPSGGSASVSGNVISGMKAGAYTIRVTDANSCHADLGLTITEPSSALTVSGTVTDPSCYGGSNGSIATNVSGGTSSFSYEWNNGSIAADPSELSAGSYTVTVTDANGCTSSITKTVLNPAVVTLTPYPTGTTCGLSTGSVILISSDASSVTLNGTTLPSGSIFNGLIPGHYKAYTNGTCLVSTFFSIDNTSPSPDDLSASASVTNPLCSGGTGSVTISPSGGSYPFTYMLDGSTSGTGYFNGLSAGDHNVLVTDAHGCSYKVYFTITVPSSLSISLSSQTNVHCYGDATGRILLAASGGTPGYTFHIQSQPPGGAATVSGNVILGMIAGPYTIRVTDANGCYTDLSNVTITQPLAALSVSGSGTSPTCYGGSDGSISINVSGGTSPFTYAWSNGSTIANPSGLVAGSYTVNITDANRCTTSGIYPVTNPLPVTITASSMQPAVCLASVGSVVLTSSDLSNITFNSETKASGSTFSGLGGGTYIATSGGTCPVSTNINLVNFTNSLWTVLSKPTGAADPTFTPNPASPTAVISGLAVGVYTLQWSNFNGASCATYDQMTITVHTATTTADAGPDQTLCNAASFQMAGNAVASGETGTWVRISGPNNPVITDNHSPTTTVTGVIPGTYVFRWLITSGTCPSKFDLVTITNRASIVLTGPTSATICIGGQQTLSVSASGGSGSYIYQWQVYNTSTPGWENISGETNATYTTPAATSSGSTNYHVIVSDQVAAANGGCSTTSPTATLTVVDDPTITGQPSDPAPICQGGTTGTITVTASGGTPSLIYQWKYEVSAGVWANVADGTPTGAVYTGGTSAGMSIAGISVAGTYHYQCVVSASGNGCTDVATNTVNVIVASDPAISSDPFGSTICKGDNHLMSVTASGGTPGLTYQWQSNTTSCLSTFIPISGATNDTYTATNVQQTTYYNVVVSATGSGCATVTSNCATVYIPTIITNPTGATICNGGTHTMSVAGSTGGGIAFSYQWQSSTTSGSGYSDITGATNASYTTDPLPTGNYYYQVLVTPTTPSCTVLPSSEAHVIVVADPYINTQPAGGTICNGGTHAMSVDAGGGTPSLTYQWYSSTTGPSYDWQPISGATTSSYTTPPLTSTTYYEVTISASGVDCNSITSNVATIIVNNLDPGVIAADQTICSGQTPSGLTSTTDASSSSGGTITYQWQSSPSGVLYGDISGATLSTYSPGSLTEDEFYRRTAISTLNGVPCTSNSNVLHIWVNNLTPGVIAADQTICDGANASAFTVTTPANGDGSLTYQWQDSSNGTIFTDISGATNATYQALALTADTWFQRIATSTLYSVPCQATSNILKVTVNHLTSGSIAGDQVICSGSTPAAFTSPYPQPTGDGALTYQWYSSTSSPSYSWISISGATNLIYAPSSLSNDQWYYRLTTSTLNGISCTSGSNVIRVQVNNVSAGSIAANQTICNGGDPAAFTNSSSPTGDGNLTYQWEKSTTSSTTGFSTIPGATNLTYDAPGPLTVNTWYQRVTTSTIGASVCTSTTSALKVTVAADPNITTQPAGATICNGGTHAMSVIAGGGTPSLTYQWYSSSSNSPYNWISISGATASSFTTPPLSSTTYYEVTVSASGLGCDPTTSDVATVTVNNLSPGVIAADQTICSGQTPSELTSTTDASSSSGGTITYQWQQGTDGISFGDISGATLNTYSPGSLTQDEYYRRTAISTLNSVPCTSNSNVLHVWVNNLTPGVIAADQTICEGSNAIAFTFTTPSTGDGSLTYQWQDSSNGTTFADINGATNTTYQALALSADTWFQRITISTLHSLPCQAISNVLKVTVNNLTPGSIAGNQVICSGSTPAAFTSPDPQPTGDGALTYQWYYSDSNSPYSWSSISGATLLTYSPPLALTNDRWYYRLTTSTLSGVPCTSASNILWVQVNNVTSGSIAASQTICNGGDPAAFTSPDPQPTGDGTLTYHWESSTTGSGSGFLPISGATNLTYDEPGPLTVNTWYHRVTTSTIGASVCTSTTSAVEVTVNHASGGSIAANQTICSGGTPNLFTSVSPATGDGIITYQWQSSSDGSIYNDIPGATNNTYQSASLTADKWFQRIGKSTLSGVTCTSLSNAVHVTVVSPPTITVDPVGSTLCSGSTWSMSVTATGGTPSLNYQWQSNTTACSGPWTNIEGATNLSYTTPVLTQTTYYQVLVSASGLGCNTATSACAIVHIPHITTQPAISTSICEGGNVTLNTAASADGGTATFTYQWQVSLMDCSFGYFTIPGATSSTYISPALNAGVRYYQCVITSSTPSCTLTTNCATVNILADPTITAQPSGGNICRNSAYTMSVAASGGTGTLSYQWQSNTNGCGSTFTAISGATSSSYTTGALTATTYYNVVITQSGAGCNQLTSNCVTVTVIQPATANAGGNASICSGNSYPLSSATASNYSSLYWSTTGTGTFNNYNTLNPVYSPSSADISAGSVTLTLHAVGNSPCTEVTSSLILSITSGISISAQPVGAIVCTGGSNTLIVAASSGTAGTLSYQWQSNTTDCNSVFSNINGATTASYSTGVLTQTNYYRVLISENVESGCGSVISDCATITVIPDPVIISQPSNATICSGSSTSLSVTASGGTGSLTYRWQSSITGCSGFSDISGATNSSCPTGALTQTTYYQVIVSQSGAGCGPVTSNCATVTVNASPVVNAGPDASICSGNTFPIVGATATSGTYSSLLWTTLGDGHFNNASDLHPIYTPGAADITTGHVTLTLTGNGNSPCSAASDPMILTITSGISISAQPVGAIVCTGGSNTLIVAASSGTAGTLSYQWQSNTTDCNSVFSNINGATTASYSTGVLTQTNYYRVLISENVESGCGSVISDCATITVIPDPVIISQPSNATICSGSSTSLSVTASGGTGSLTYRWQSSITGCSGFSDISGATNSSCPTGALTQTTYYQVIVSQSGAGCGPVTSNCATVTVNASPVVNAGPDASICSGNTFPIVGATATSGTYSSLLWTTSGDGYFNNNTTLHPVYTPGVADIAAHTVTLTLTGNGNTPCSPVSDAMVLSITTSLSITTQPVSSIICTGGTYTLNVTPTGGPGSFTYQWQSNTEDCNFTFTNIDGATNSAYTTPALTHTTYYKVVISPLSGTCSPVTSDCATVTVLEDPIIYTQPSSGTVCNGGTFGMYVVASGGTGTLSYQWQSNTTNCSSAFADISGATNSGYTTVPLSQTTYYRVVVSQTGSGCGPVTSNCATVTVNAPPTANAGANATICAGTSYPLSSATASNYASVYWSTSGTGTFNNYYTLNPVYTPSAADITAVHVTLTLHAEGNLPCGEVTASMILTLQKPPVAYAGPDATICEPSSYCLCSATAKNYTCINWEAMITPGVPGTGTFSDIHAINPVYTPSAADIAAGNVYLILHLCATAPCTDVTDTMKLCISRIPQAYAGADAMICEGFTYPITDATASHYTALSWTTSGTGTFNNTGIINPIYTPSNADIVAGFVTLTLNLTAQSPCPNASDAMILTIHRNPTATAYVVSNVSCHGLSDGVVSVSATGGTTPYTYLWSTTATTQTVSGLSVGTYSVTVTDNFGCRNYSQTTLGQPPLLTVSGTVVQNVRCNGGNEGLITITAGGGTTPYSYHWSNSATSQNISGLTAGTYSVTVTDAHTCTATGNWTITEPALLTVAGNVTHNVLCKGGSEGAISITAGGGTTSYSYLWSNNATTAAISGLTAGTYTVTVTDAHTCTVTGDWTITEPAILTVTGTVTHEVLCKGGSDGSIVITASGGTTSYSYAWSNNATTQNISGLTAGTYIVTVTDAHSCTTSGSWTVTEPTALSISGTVTNATCYTYSNGAINVTYGGGVTPYSYLWSNASTTGSISNLSAGTYSVTVTDAHSCTLSDSWSVTQPPPWSVVISGCSTPCCGTGNSYAYSATLAGSYTNPVSYLWTVVGGTITSGQNTPNISVTWSCCGQGTVNLHVTESGTYNCSLNASNQVAVYAQPDPVIAGPASVPADTTNVHYSTAYYAGHSYNWTVTGGSIASGQGTSSITVNWGSYPTCGCGSVSVCETNTTTGCVGCTTMNITIIPGNQHNLDGYVYYKNGYNTGLNGVIVNLRNLSTGIIIATDTTGPDMHPSHDPGYFSFSSVPAGSYQLDASFNGTWGGNNATDALIVQLYVAGSYTLTGLNKAVGDVNASGTWTGLDALYIKLRTVGAIDSYPAGNWMFDNPTVSVTPSPVSQNIFGLCVGDVNGSYIPTGLKDASFLSVVNDGVQTIPVNQQFTYNIKSNQVADLGAMTLFMNYDQSRFEIERVNVPSDEMKYRIAGGRIAIAWSGTKPISVRDTETVISLHMKTMGAIKEPAQIFEIMPGSEFADPFGNRFDNFELKMASVVTPGNPKEFILFNYPNPFNNNTTILYTLPENCKVKLVLTNLLGNTLATLVDNLQVDAGTHTINVNPLEYHLSAGVYLYRIEAVGSSETFIKTNKLIFEN